MREAVTEGGQLSKKGNEGRALHVMRRFVSVETELGVRGGKKKKLTSLLLR